MLDVHLKLTLHFYKLDRGIRKYVFRCVGNVESFRNIFGIVSRGIDDIDPCLPTERQPWPVDFGLVKCVGQVARRVKGYMPVWEGVMLFSKTDRLDALGRWPLVPIVPQADALSSIQKVRDFQFGGD